MIKTANGVKIAVLTALLMLMIPTAARTEIGLIVSAANLRGQDSDLSPTGGVAILVCDTAGDGFSYPYFPSGLPITVGSFWGNDQIVARWDLGGLNTPGQLLGYAKVPTPAGPRQFRLYWFPSKSAYATVVGCNAWGYYSDATGIDGSAPWVAPADGTLVQLNFYTASRGGTNPDTAGRAGNYMLDCGSITNFISTLTATADGSNTVLTFSTAYYYYNILSTTDMVSGAWSTIASNIAGTNGVQTYIDIGGASGPQRYYRVLVQ